MIGQLEMVRMLHLILFFYAAYGLEEQMDLSNRNLTVVNKSWFANTTNINLLNLSGNELTNLPEDLFDNLTSLQKIYLNDNLWDCNCSLIWLSGWLQRNVNVTHDDPRCHRPARLYAYPLMNLTTLTEFESCNYSCISWHSEKNLSHITSINSIAINFTGKLTQCAYATITLADESMTFVISYSGIYTKNEFLLPTTNRSFNIAYNTSVMINLDYRENLNSTCEGYVYVFKNYAKSSKGHCPPYLDCIINTLSNNISSCQTNVTLLDIIENSSIHFQMITGEKNRFSMVVNLTPVILSKDLNIHYTPNPNYENCSLQYEVNTNITWFVDNFSSRFLYTLFINNTIHKRSLSKQLWYVFPQNGTFRVHVLVKILNKYLSWNRTIHVRKNIYRIHSIPHIDQTFPSNTSIKLFVIKKDRCVIANNETFLWLIDGHTIPSSENTIFHSFPSVGTSSRKVSISLKRNPADVLTVRIYDKISGFKVYGVSGMCCLDDNFTFTLSHATGSDVSYKYRLSTDTIWRSVNGSVVTLAPSIHLTNIVFLAMNNISEMIVTKHLHVVEYVFFHLGDKYYHVNHSGPIKPKIIHTCVPFSYQWTIGTRNYSWYYVQRGIIPFVTYSSNAETEVNVLLKIRFNTNTSIIVQKSSAHIYWEYPIKDVMLHSNVKDAYIGDTVNLHANVLSNSSYYTYRWVIHGSRKAWYKVQRGYIPLYNVSFNSENIYRIQIQVRNNITLKVKTLSVLVQYPLIINRITPLNVFAEVGKEFHIKFNLQYFSIFSYTVKVDDGENLNVSTMIRKKAYDFSHTYHQDRKQNISFLLGDKFASKSFIIPVSVLRPVQIIKYNLKEPIVVINGKYIFKNSDFIQCDVTYTGSGNITISWYLDSVKEDRLFGTGINFPQKPLKPGNYVIWIVGRNEISESSVNFSIIVESEKDLHLSLAYSVNTKTNNLPQLAVSANTLVQFEVSYSEPTNIILKYTWFLHNVEQPKVKGNTFNYDFKDQGRFTILVKVTTLFTTKQISMEVFVQNMLQKAHLMATCGGNSTQLENETVIPRDCKAITINHIYFDPTNTKYVSGRLSCFQIMAQVKSIIFEESYERSLTSGLEFPVKDLIGYIYCDVILNNNVSVVTSTYSYLRYLNAKLTFLKPTKYVALHDEITYNIGMHNVSVDSILRIHITNETYNCVVPVATSFYSYKTCTFNMSYPGTSMVSATLTNKYANITTVLEVYVVEKINVYVSPLTVEYTSPIRINVFSKTQKENSYFWPEYNSNSSYIIYKADKVGIHGIHLFVSNELFTKHIVVNITVYPYFNDVSIMVDSLYVRTYSNVSFQSSIVEPLLDYRWYLNSVKIKPLIGNKWKIWKDFSIPGTYNISVNVSSVFRFVVADLTINVLNQVSDFQITIWRNRDNSTLVPSSSDNLLLGSTQYTFSIAWNCDGTCIVSLLSLEGILDINKSYSDHSAIGSFTTFQQPSNVRFRITVQNEVSTSNASWTYYSHPVIYNVYPRSSHQYVSINEIITFWTQRIPGNTSYVWYINSKHRLFGARVSMNTSHFANTAGKYLITLLVYGPFISNGSVSESFYVTVFSENCKKPYINDDADIIGREVLKSQWFYTDLNITSVCNIQHNWYFETANIDSNCSSFSSRELYRSDKLLPAFKKSTLEVPPRYFEIGNYCVKNNITYGKSGILNIGFHLRVRQSRLIPVISGGSYRILGNRQSISLNASNTIDPDAPYNFPQTLLYKWLIYSSCCHYNVTNITYPFQESPSVVLSNNLSLFEVNNVYHVQLTVKRKYDGGGSGEPATATQQIKIVNGTLPLVQIDCITCRIYKSSKYIRERSLKLKAQCVNCGTLQPKYIWSVVGVKDGKEVLMDARNIATSRNSSLLVINAFILDGLQGYVFVLNASVEGMDGTGSTSIYIENNVSPQNGTCTLTPPSGYTMVTSFHVQCDKWTDQDNVYQPLTYVLVSGGEEKTVFYRGPQSEFHVYLPVGKSVDDWMINVEVLVEDALGAHTVAFKRSVRVTLSPLAESNPSEFILTAVFPLLERSVANNDINQVGSAVVASSLLLKNNANDKNGSIALNGLVDGATSVLPFSVETIDQVVNAQSHVMKKSGLDDVTLDNRYKVLQSLTSMLNIAEGLTIDSLSLTQTAHTRFMWLITDNMKFFVAKEKRQIIVAKDGGQLGVRERRSVDENADQQITDQYNLLEKFYKIIMSTKMSGEKEVVLSGEDMSTRLLKHSGDQLLGSNTLDQCEISIDISRILGFEEAIRMLECSRINYFNPSTQQEKEEGYPMYASVTYRDLGFNEMVFDNLTSPDGVTITLPTTTTTTASYQSNNATPHTKNIEPGTLVVLLLPNITYASMQKVTGVHVVFDVAYLKVPCLVHVHFTKDEQISVINETLRLLTFSEGSKESERTVFITDYNVNSTYYIGIEHTCTHTLPVHTTMYSTSCVYWNVWRRVWENNGCRSTRDTTRHHVVCTCNHLSTFTSQMRLVPNVLDFTVLTRVNFTKNSVALSTCIVVLLIYFITLYISYKRDEYERKHEHVIPVVDSVDGFYQYEVRFKTGIYPWAGTTSNVHLKIFGTGCTTKARLFHHEGCFMRNGLDIFSMSVPESIGKVHKIHVWHDNSGENPSWYVERVVIRSFCNGEKFFFFCNRWLTTDSMDGTLDSYFYVADIEEIQRFSTIFFDFIKRGFTDYHLWLSVFEKPKYSKFTRVQRVTCLLSFILTWLAVNAMWFQVAPEGKVDVYLGLKGYSFEEVIIAVISVAMVVPLHVVVVMLFRKSKEAKGIDKPLKIWKATPHYHMEEVEILPLLREKDDEEDFRMTSQIRKKEKCFNLDELCINGDFLNERDSTTKDKSSVPWHTIHLPIPLETHHPPKPITKDTESLTSFVSHTMSAPLLSPQGVDMLGMDGLDTPRYFEPFAYNEKKRRGGGVAQMVGVPKVTKKYKTKYARKDNSHDSIIKRNELLAKQLGIPDIYELDASTRWLLPHYCVYIGYLICFVTSLFSILVIITYVEGFGYELAIKWLRVFFIGFLEDIILQYPFMVIMAACITALFIKPLDLDKIDHYDFVTCKPGDYTAQPSKTTLKPLCGVELAHMQRTGRKRMKMHRYIKKVLLHVTLVWCVVCISNISFDVDVHDILVKKYVESFSRQLNSAKDYYPWLLSTWKKIQPTSSISNHWLPVSTPSVYQLHKPDINCDVGVDTSNSIYTCMSTLFKETFMTGLNAVTNTTNITTFSRHYSQLSHMVKSSHTTLLGNVSFSSLTGQQWMLPIFEPYQVSNQTTLSMKYYGWLDCRNCILNHEFVFYVPALNQYVYASLTFIQKLFGYVKITSDVRLFRNDVLLRNIDVFCLVCIILLIIITLYIIFQIRQKFRRKGHVVFTSYSYWHTMAIAVFSCVTSVMLIYRMVVWKEFRGLQVGSRVPVGVGSKYILGDDVTVHVCGVLCFLVITKMVHLLKCFHMHKYTSTVRRCMSKMVALLCVHTVVMFIFATYALMVFQPHIFDYRSLWNSFLSTLFHRWDKTNNFQQMVRVSSGHAAFLELLWSVYWYLVPICLMRAVVVNGYKDKELRSNRSGNLLASLYKRLFRQKKSIGITSRETSEDVGESDVTFVEEKISETIHGTETVHGNEAAHGNETVHGNEAVSEPPLPPLNSHIYDIHLKLSSLLERMDQMTEQEVIEDAFYTRVTSKYNDAVTSCHC